MNSTFDDKKIVVSDHFATEKILALTDEFVTPYLTGAESEFYEKAELLKPRRLLGNYLTYLVKDVEKTYSVIIKKNQDKYGVQCDCPEYNQNEKCRHIAEVLVAMQVQLNEESLIKSRWKAQEEMRKKLQDEESETKNLLHFTPLLQNDLPFGVKGPIQKNIKNLDPEILKQPFIITNAKDFSFYRIGTLIPSLRNASKRNKHFAKITGPVKGFDVSYQHYKEKQTIAFRVNENDDIEIKCSCGLCYRDQICIHAVDCIYFLNDEGGFSQFVPYTNLDKEKNQLLADFGLSVEDEESKEFKFASDYSGKLSLSFVPSHYVSMSRLPKIKELIVSDAKKKMPFKPREENYDIGIYFQLSHRTQDNAPLKIEAYKIETSKKGEEKISRVYIGKEENLHLLSILEETRYNVLMDFSYITFKEYIGPSYYTQSYQHFQNQFYEATRKQYLKHFLIKVEEHWSVISRWEKIKLLADDENFAKSNLTVITLAPEPVYAEIHVKNNDKFITLQVSFTDGDGKVVIGANDTKDIYEGKLIFSDNTLYLHKRNELNKLLQSMPKGKLSFSAKHGENIVKEILHPLSSRYGVSLPEDLKIKVRESVFVPAVHLRELDDKYLVVAPKFYYDDLIIDMTDLGDHYFDDEKGHQLLIRNSEEESAFVEFMRSMHHSFKNQSFQPHFFIPFEDVMKNQWFIHFSKQLMNENIRMVGFNELKRFRYNSATPKWDMNISSGIDWFDIQVTAEWGDQVIQFKEIKKAILNGQDFVVLGDGSFGMLPAEWISKYSTLFKFAVDDKSGLKVSKKHFNIVELLFDQINDEDILAEIEEKKQKLLRIEDVKPQPIPDMIQATLRPYQETGYQWMQVLDEISWGGCLADDMGLGKTLQAITFLAFLKEKYSNPTSLIICPTSLIYNWESELKKFAPQLRYHLFYGSTREFSDEHFNDYDIIISSYGIVRNDIETLVNFDWEYIILDESQAIKNPDAISTKAVQLLRARNKFILSGTPMQNNTYDIYAQFNFLNPGLLGGKEFFRHEFANPIDKEGNKDAGILLRRLIKPFMLRRTKSEVAPDLPEKTEMILWCQMDKAQKVLYDEYKDYYRHALIQKIDTEGIAKAGVYILEGLLRLRQICDDPRLIKDKESKATKGVKILELTREIKENIGDHKMLVFSQFTEMLALIRDELDENNIKYCYLDGGTSAIQRQEQVEIFQQQKEIHVFLISLKAGGVGLNLTEADYVYIVDPWWNPAVEQQAIDRTHRIGQKNKIFAYKMICKDSVEEKIIQLQEKKMSISKEIIQEDSAFFKSLTKDDIGFLFS